MILSLTMLSLCEAFDFLNNLLRQKPFSIEETARFFPSLIYWSGQEKEHQVSFSYSSLLTGRAAKPCVLPERKNFTLHTTYQEAAEATPDIIEIKFHDTIDPESSSCSGLRAFSSHHTTAAASMKDSKSLAIYYDGLNHIVEYAIDELNKEFKPMTNILLEIPAHCSLVIQKIERSRSFSDDELNSFESYRSQGEMPTMNLFSPQVYMKDEYDLVQHPEVCWLSSLFKNRSFRF